MRQISFPLERALTAAGGQEVAELCRRYRGSETLLLDALGARARDSQPWAEILAYAEREGVQSLDDAAGEFYVF